MGEASGTVRLGAAGTSLAVHAERGATLDELHSRPFTRLRTPCRVVHFAFVTGEAEARRDLQSLRDFCRRHGVPPPAEGARYHRARIGEVGLRWERHSEFTTYTLDVAAAPAEELFPREDCAALALAAALPQPGPVMVASRLALLPEGGADKVVQRLFDPASLCVSEVKAGDGLIAGDFRADEDGFTRFLVEDRALGAERAGRTVQRLLEIETYRSMALLGLFEAQRTSPFVQRVEAELTDVTGSMMRAGALDDNRALLARLTALAAELEAQAARSSYRFGASRAYGEILQQRLVSIGETPYQRYSMCQQFLARRMNPAMRTCQTTEERLEGLSEKLARTATLLRTRVDIELESQNRDLLQAMNERARMQLRLQQTVEGLSVAAVSYYIVGLIAYLARGGEYAGLPLNATLLTAAAAPVVILTLAYLVYRIRRVHSEAE